MRIFENRWLFLIMLALANIFLAGCETIVNSTIATANRIDQARDQERRSDLLAQHLDDIRALQVKGDPLGDYLWAEANDNKIVKNAIQNPETIQQLYEVAADRGSVDARLVLAIKKFKQGAYPRLGREQVALHEQASKQQNRAIHPMVAAAKKRLEDDPTIEYTPFLSDLKEIPIREAAWREGMKQTEEASQQRCFFYFTYIFAPLGRRCLAPSIAADKLWPSFRDGVGAYPKDKTLRDHWYDKAIACEQTTEYKKAVKQCEVLERSGYRAKD